LSAEFILKKRLKLEVSGIVQGVGFRPFVYQLALKNSLCGFVLNHGGGLTIEVEGVKSALEAFVNSLTTSAPELSRIDTVQTLEIPTQNSDTFAIIQSNNTDTYTMVSADMSLCEDCKAEMQDPHNRRYKYPFINCTNCGPRYTIIDTLPYDRKGTSMAKFEMCEECREEYEDPTSRRFHAQPISCHTCGPKLSYFESEKENFDESATLIYSLSESIKDGKIGALKGVGGFHIICDATNEDAVEELRKKKRRPTKPLAVMFKNIEEIEKVCFVSKNERMLLLSKERPIVLLTQKRSSHIAKGVAPNIDILGVFLPYTPLHELLLSQLNFPIVATSANLSDEPIIRDETELFEKLPHIIESALSNDREILNACDDSVVMSVEDETIMLRLSRGYAPQSFYTKKKTSKKILALGANQKSTLALAFEDNIIISPHIGDLNSLEAFEYFVRTLDTFKRFYDFEPDVIVCDKHPEYATTKWAKAYVQSHPRIELIEVQHHHAHALACMAEHTFEGEALAFCFDGTGYGDEEGETTLWGGEVLRVTPESYTREYHLKEFSLLGGEKAVREPRRVVLALLFEYYSYDEVLQMENELINSFTKSELNTFSLMHRKNLNSPKSSSMGRLFDAIYALSGNYEELGYEGESGLIIEKNAHDAPCDESYSYSIKDDIIDIKEMLVELLKEKDTSIIASKFLNTLVSMMLEISKRHTDLPVILSGGVFQNKTLLQKTMQAFKSIGVRYYVQNQTPINDGGISLGQVYHALHRV
jgi:hydrogenase maturation protein HypF